jgi:hypothetical protein
MVILLQLGAVALCSEVARATPPEDVAGNLRLRGTETFEAPIAGDGQAAATSVGPKSTVAPRRALAPPIAVSLSRSTGSSKPTVAPVSPTKRSAVAYSEPGDYADTNCELDVAETGNDVGLIGEATPAQHLKQGIPEGLLRGGSDESLSPQGAGAWKLLVDEKSAYKMPKIDGQALLRDRAPQAFRLFARRKPNREFPAGEVVLSGMALLALVFGRSMLTAMRRRKAERGLAY